MEIKPHILRAFCAVVASESLQEAGARVGRSASALSRIIAELEIELGVQLFDRSERRMAPTPAAREFFPRARDALLLWDDLARFGRAIGKDKRSILRVAALSRHAESIVAPAVARLMRDEADLDVVMLDLHAQRDFDYSRLARPFDIGFGNLASSHTNLDSTVLAQSEIVVVVPGGHPLAAASTISPQELAEFPLVQLQRDTVIGKIVREQLGGTPEFVVVAEVSHTQLALRLVIEGAGLHVTDRLAAVGARDKGCRLIPLKPGQSVAFLAFWPHQPTALTGPISALMASVVTEIERSGDDR